MSREQRCVLHLEYLLDKDDNEINELFNNWLNTNQSEINLCEILLYQLMKQHESKKKDFHLNIFSYFKNK